MFTCEQIGNYAMGRNLLTPRFLRQFESYFEFTAKAELDISSGLFSPLLYVVKSNKITHDTHE